MKSKFGGHPKDIFKVVCPRGWLAGLVHSPPLMWMAIGILLNPVPARAPQRTFKLWFLY